MVRPVKSPAERRDARIGIRLTPAERAELELHASAYGITAAEFIRSRSLGYRLPATRAGERELARVGTALIRLGVNLNQIAMHMNAGRGAPDYLAHLIARIEAELDKLYDTGDHEGRPVL